MSTTTTHLTFSASRMSDLLIGARNGNTWLWRTAILMGGFSILLFAAQLFDPRLINGVNVWDKPAKFFLSFTLHYATVSWALSVLPVTSREMPRVRWAAFIMLAAGWGEMAYIVFRAARGEGSHFNTATPAAAILYGLMGFGAVTLTATSGYIGFTIWRQRAKMLWREAAALGLMVGAVLGTIAGAYMSQHNGHWVGGTGTDAHALTFFNWSVTGGDLRVAHFAGLHATQLIPLAALSGDRRIVWSVVVLCIATTAGLFIMGALGMPLLRA